MSVVPAGMRCLCQSVCQVLGSTHQVDALLFFDRHDRIVFVQSDDGLRCKHYFQKKKRKNRHKTQLGQMVRFSVFVVLIRYVHSLLTVFKTTSTTSYKDKPTNQTVTKMFNVVCVLHLKATVQTSHHSIKTVLTVIYFNIMLTGCAE